MPNFLDLEVELRDLIYIAVLISEVVSPPSSPAECGPRRQLLNYDSVHGEAFEYSNMYPLKSVSRPESALLLTCHQIHDEFVDVITRIHKSKMSPYKLDCMMVDEQRIYPTWLSMPALRPANANVNVDFRIFGDCKGQQSEWSGGDGGPSVMIWSLFALLRRFLLRGPDFLSSPSSKRGVRIDVLTLNVITPFPPPENGFIPQGVGYHRRAARHGMMHPETLLYEIEHHMMYLLGRGRHTAAEATAIYKRVGFVRFCLGGEERNVFDLAAVVARDPSAAAES